MNFCPSCKVDGWTALHMTSKGLMCWRCTADNLNSDRKFHWYGSSKEDKK